MVKRVGHGGAGALAPANTLDGFNRALELGVDMVEFDVRPHRGSLVLAHTPLDAWLRPCATFGEALRHLGTPEFDAIELNVDVKRSGIEAAVVDGLRRHGLIERAVISCQAPRILDRVRELAPEARTGISIGGPIARAYHRWSDWRETLLSALATGRFSAVMAHHPLVDRELCERVRDAGREIYAWTVDERDVIDRLGRLGVTGITTNDLRLFHGRIAA